MIPLSDGIRALRFPFVNIVIVVANFAVSLCSTSSQLVGTAAGTTSSGNMVFLVVFGKNVEDSFGHLRYLFFYFAGGFVAMLTQGAMTLLAGNAAGAHVANPGASGAIAAVGVFLPRLLVPLPAVRGEFRAVRLERQRRRRRLLRPRRWLRLRHPRHAAARNAGRVSTPDPARAAA